MKLKLKIKVTSKELTLFILFCIVLLYVSSVSVVNLFEMINKQEFAGLNPIPGLLPPYLFATLIVFFEPIMLLILGVSRNAVYNPKVKVSQHGIFGRK